MKVTIFQNGKPGQIILNDKSDADALIFLNSLVSEGYISGFLAPLGQGGMK